MKLRQLAGFVLVLGLVAVSGCVQPPPPAPAAAAPVAPPPPVPAAPVALVPPPAAPVPMARHHVATVHHVVVHHVAAQRHWGKRYHAVAVYAPPGCGADFHPCNEESVVVPIK